MRAPAGSKMHSPASWNRPVLKLLTPISRGSPVPCRQPRIDGGPGECLGCTIETWTACPLSSAPSSCRRSGAETPSPSFSYAGCCMPLDTAIGFKGTSRAQRSRKFSGTTRMHTCPEASSPAGPTSSFPRGTRRSSSTDASGTCTTVPQANTRPRRMRNSGNPNAPAHVNGTNAPLLPSGNSVGSRWFCGSANSETPKSSWISWRGSWDRLPVPPGYRRNKTEGP